MALKSFLGVFFDGRSLRSLVFGFNLCPDVKKPLFTGVAFSEYLIRILTIVKFRHDSYIMTELQVFSRLIWNQDVLDKRRRPVADQGF